MGEKKYAVKGKKMLRSRLRMTYYYPTQSMLFSEPQVFETQDGEEWERAVNIAHEKGYVIVGVERLPNRPASRGPLGSAAQESWDI